MTTPVLAFANYTKPFLLETDVSKDGLGVVLSQKQTDGQQSPYASWEKLPLDKTWVFGVEVGSYGTLQGVPPLSTLPHKDGQ